MTGTGRVPAEYLVGSTSWGILSHCQPSGLGSGLGSEDSQGGEQETSFLLAPPTQPARKGAASKGQQSWGSSAPWWNSGTRQVA